MNFIHIFSSNSNIKSRINATKGDQKFAAGNPGFLSVTGIGRR